jgi:hypothetical protein
LKKTRRKNLPVTASRIVDKGPVLYITASLPPGITCMVTYHTFKKTGL